METTGNSAPECCGEPMLRHKPLKVTRSPWWECRVENRARCQRRYERLSGPEYNRLLLEHRRTKGLARQRKRKVA